MADIHEKALEAAQCMASVESPAAKRRRKFRRAIERVKFEPYLIYARTLYRPHMRFLHKRGKHWWKHYHMIDGAQFDKCEWCGAYRGEE